MKIKKDFILDIPDGENLITESFGLSTGRKFSICDIEVPDEYSVLLIKGESGSGKTTILKEMFPDNQTIAVPNKPLYLWAGDSVKNQQKAISIFTSCGLSDAVQFVSKYEQLSDSQRARADIALQIISGKKIIIVDEFLSTLDRKTAKATAYCIQKYIRKIGLKLVATTAHDDLAEYLLPDVEIVGKAYPSRFVCNTLKPDITGYPWNIKLEYKTKDDYRELRLGELHYKGKYTGGAQDYLFAYINNEIVGVLVSIYNRATGGKRIARVVVHPSYRGIGIGKALIKKYVSDFESVDVVAAMALFNPVFERAGMQRVKDTVIKSPKGFKTGLQKIGFDLNKINDKTYCIEASQKEEIRTFVSNYSSKATDIICPGGCYLSDEEIKKKIVSDENACSRVIFGLRDRILAKYVKNSL